MNANAREYLDIQLGLAPNDRSLWQWGCVDIWAQNHFRSTVEACTGSGKTRIGMHAIQMLRRNDDSRKVIFVVPTRQLKTQTEKELKRLKLKQNTEVWVINSLIKGHHECDLLILDEMHRYAATTFSLVFSRVKYKFLLGLTATFNRLDGKHHFLRAYAPVRSKLSTAQARSRGWIADYREYWLGLELGPQEQEEYDKLEDGYMRNMKPFHMDFGLAIAAMEDRALCEDIASRIQGYDWSNIRHCAINALKYIRKIKKMISDNKVKLDTAAYIIEQLGRKTLTFGETIEGAEYLSAEIGSKARTFHSEMDPIIIDTFKDKIYKTERGARRWCERHPGWEYKVKRGKHVAQTRVQKKLAGESLRQHTLHKIINTAQVNVLCTAKALNEGFDYPGAELGLTTSRSSSSTVYTQQVGRVCRLGANTRPVMIHLYLKNTRDQRWLEKAGQNAVGVIKVNTAEEVLDLVRQLEIPAVSA